MTANAMSPPESLRDAVSHLNSLPSIPKIAQKILSLKLITDEGERTLLKLIEQDPLLSAKVIGMANAPLFGAAREIMTVRDAATVLGIKRVKMIALGFAMMSSMTKSQTGLLNVQNLWQHSLAVAMAMHTLSRAMPDDMRPSDDEIFLAGLLHDIGFLVLNYVNPKLSDKFHTRLTTEVGRPVEEIEAEMLEVGHGELGAELGRYWNLPEAIVTVLRYHHQPGDARAAVGQPLVMMANMAEKLLPTLGMLEHIQQDISIEEWQALGIDSSRADEIKALVQKHNQEVMGSFSG
jgi:putative nucleotidyltransferase with HDIG domain